MNKTLFPIRIVTTFIALFLSIMFFPESSDASYLTARGGMLYNDNQEAVHLTGVNWFGFETTNMFPHGLWARDYHGVLLQIRDMGFNCVRIPFCDEMLQSDAKPDKPNFYGEDPFYPRDKTEFNKELAGLSPIEMLDEIIRFAGVLGLTVILDNHSREHDGYMNEKLWYTAKISEETWINDWVMLAARYRNNPTVIGFDLENEPHGKTVDNGSTWAAGVAATDWNEAAQKCGNAILAVNPDVLIIIEGVEQYGETMYWWGGNLRGVKQHPITLSKPEKLVYSPHEYGPEVFQQPWFFTDAFPSNMESIWDEAFGYIAKENIAPLFIGEFGISSMDGYEGRAGTWLTTFIAYMAKLGLSFTFWALNPNSGDTGGMLSNDWVSPVTWKLDQVKPLCAPLINEPMAVRQPQRRTDSRKISFLTGGNSIQAVDCPATGLQIRLIDLQGRTIRSSVQKTLSLSEVPRGMYMSVLYVNGRARLSEPVMVE